MLIYSKMKCGIFTIFLFLLISTQVFSQDNVRTRILFDDDWKFQLGEVEEGQSVSLKDNSWRTVNLPHDWSIEPIASFNPSDRVVLNIVRDAWHFSKGDIMAWREPEYNDAAWKTVNLPQSWVSHSNYTDADAYGWFRKTIVFQKKNKGKEIYLNLGYIADVDQVYLNGEIIGNSGSFPPDFRSASHLVRQYKVPEGMIDWGKPQSLAIRVYAKNAGGGIYEKGDAQRINGAYDSHADNGRSSGFTRNGIGWYRKTFKVETSFDGKKVQLLFGGIYRNATIWLNGQELIKHPNGHTSFWVDISSHLNYSGKNILAVRVDNSGHSSRWYTGSGIYRHVWMETKNKIHIDNWGVRVSTESLDENGAAINLIARVKSEQNDTVNVRFRTEIMGPDNEQVVFDVREQRIFGGTLTEIKQNFLIAQPKVWSLDSSKIYTAVSTININGEFIDRLETPFGIRTIKFDTLNGFQLNDKPILLKGGNIRSDNGILGARSFDDAEDRKVRILKMRGFNAVRCAGNPPSSSFLDACDKYGLLVIEDAFDSWQQAKVAEDYSMHFNEWWQKDLRNIVQRDLNHPSLIMWSIGNEVKDSLDKSTAQLASKLAGFTRILDPSRPVTATSTNINLNREYADTFFSALDVAGYNYDFKEYQTDHKNYPNRIMLGTESYPSKIKESWQEIEKLPYVIGDFTWSAMDYLGEAGKGWYSFENEPVDLFPWTTAYCGDLDLLGCPRPQWYFRKTVWEKRPQTYIMVKPARSTYKTRTRVDWGWQDAARSWSWHGHEMVFFEVYVYSNCDRIKLYQNGKVVSERRISEKDNNMALFYVPYNPGSLRAIGFNGKNPVAQDILKTVGLPAKIAIKADVNSLEANGQDLMFLEVQVQDAKGELNPMARAPINFSIKGPAEIIAVGNSDPQNTNDMTDLHHSTFNGRCIAVIRAQRKPGEVIVDVSAKGVKTETLVFQVR